jgi:hypothetical protein
MGGLFHLPTLVGVELYFKTAAAFVVAPAGIHSLVLIVRPRVLSHAKLKALVFEDRCGLTHGPNIILAIRNKCVPNAIMNLVYVLLNGLVWFVSNQFVQFLFESIRLFEGVLLGVFDQGSTVESGLDLAHGRRETAVAVVAVRIASFGIVTFGKALVGGMGLLRCQMAVLPSPRTVGPDTGLVFYRSFRRGRRVGFIEEGEFVFGQIQWRRLARTVVAIWG